MPTTEDISDLSEPVSQSSGIEDLADPVTDVEYLDRRLKHSRYANRPGPAGTFPAEGPVPSVQWGPFTPGAVGGGMLGAGQRIGSLLARIPGAQVLGMPKPEEFHQARANLEAERQAAGEVWSERLVRGATENLLPAALTSGAGVGAAIATGSAITADSAYEEGKAKGLSGANLAGYVSAQAGAEALGEILPAKLGGSILTLMQKARKSGVSPERAFWTAAKSVAGDMAGEAGTQIVQSAIDSYSGVDPNALDWDRLGADVGQAVAQSALMGAAVTVPHVGLSVLERRLAAVQAVRDKGYVSAEDGQKFGIPGETRKERLANADAEITQLEQEIQNAQQISQAGQTDEGGGARVEAEVPQGAESEGGEGVYGGGQVGGEVSGQEAEAEVRVDERPPLLEAPAAAEAAAPEQPKRDVAAEIRAALAEGPVTVSTPRVKNVKVGKVLEDGTIVSKRGVKMGMPDDTWVINPPKPAEAPAKPPESLPEAPRQALPPEPAPVMETQQVAAGKAEEGITAPTATPERREHVVTFEKLELKKTAAGRPRPTPLIKELANTVAEFRYDPTLVADKKGKLVFRDGYKFAFEPEQFGLGKQRVGVDRKGIETFEQQVKPGDVVRVDLESMGVKPAQEADVVAEALEAQGFSNVRPVKGGMAIRASWKGHAIEAGQLGKEQWKAAGSGISREAVDRANQTIERIRWSQPGDPNAGPSKGKLGPSLGGLSTQEPPVGLSQNLSQRQPAPKPEAPKKSRGKEKAAKVEQVVESEKPVDMSSAIAEELAKRKPQKRSERAAERKEAAKQRFLEAGRRLIDPTKLTSGLDPSKIKDAVDAVLAAIDYGVASFDEFVSLAVESFGEQGVRDKATYLEEAARQGGIKDVTSVAGVLDKPPPKTPEKKAGEQPPSEETTGPKNVKTDELREKAGMEERPPVEPKESVEEWEAAAAKRMAEDPQYAPKMAEELAAKPKAIDQLEQTILGRYLNELENRRKAGEDVYDELRTAVEASERVGTIWGRTGVSRQVELAADFTVAGIVRQHLRSVNKAPTDEQIEKYAELADQLAKREGELTELQKKLAQTEVDLRIAEAKAAVKSPAPSEKKGTRRAQLRQKASEAVANFKKEWDTLFQLGAISDPKREAEKWVKITKTAGSVVKAYAELGVDSFLELLSNLGTLTSQQKDAFREAWDQHMASVKKEAPETPDHAAIGELARKLTQFAVESGITDREEVIDAVHKELTDMGFKVGRSDTMAAMSGYGDFRELSKDEVSVKVRGIKGEIQQLLKLEDMQEGQAPKKTGVERREPTDEERRLIKQVNEAKKKGGYIVTDPDRQLQSAIGAAKTAARNRIADLENAIAKRERIVSGQTKLTPDAELTALRKQRDELNEEYRKIFPPKKTGMPDAARLKAAEKMLDKMLADLKADLAAGLPGKDKKEPLTSPALDAKKKELKALREKIKLKKQAGLAEWESEGGAIEAQKGRKPLTDAQKLKIREQSLQREIENLQADLNAGRLSPKPKAQPLSSTEIEAKQRQLEQLKDVREQARAASPEYQAKEAAKQNARYKKSLERQLAMWETRRDEAASGILPKKHKPTPLDNEILEKKFQIEQVKRHARAEIEEAERAARGLLGKALGFGGDLLDLQRAIWLGPEMSFVMLQGAPYTFGHPIKAARALTGSVRSFFSRRADFALHDNLLKRPNHIEYMRGEMDTTATDGPLSHREELVASRLASILAKQEGAAWALPRWAAEGVLGFERAFRAFANTMRADIFDYMKASVDSSRPGTWSEDDAKVLGSAAMDFSGRSKLPFGMSAVGMGRIFLAPRWVWSRARLLTGAPLWKGDRATRLAIGKVYVRGMLGFGGYMLIRHFLYSLLAGDDEEHKPKYELDPRSGDVSKMRIGETRVGSGAGFISLVTLAARIATGETKTSSGQIVPIRGDDVPYGADDTRDVIHRFLDTKLAPLPSGVLDWIVGENVIGEKATVGKIVGERITPMTWRDIWEAEKELNVPQGTVAAIDAFFGAGMSTHGPRTKARQGPEQKQEVLFSAFERMDVSRPMRKDYKSDEKFQKATDRFTYANARSNKEIKAVAKSLQEAKAMLDKYYRTEKGGIYVEGKADLSYVGKLRQLKRIYAE